MNTVTIKGEIIKKYLKEFPGAANHTLAAMIYKANKKVFLSSDGVRSMVRYYRGANGEKNISRVSDKSFLNQNVEKKFMPKLPDGLTTLDDWRIIVIEGDNKILRLCDTHIPYHSKQAIELAVKNGAKKNPNIILLDGDITDHFSISDWVKNPELRDFKEEIITTRSFLTWLRAKFPKARIIWKKGNHEEWYDRYMYVKAPELLGIDKFSFESIYEVDKYGIEVIGDKKPLRFNKLHSIHGHEYKFAITNPVNPARGLFLRAKVSAICGHYHQSSKHSEPSLAGKSISCWSTGCLCDLHPDWMPLNKWEHGYADIETYGTENYQVSNYVIMEGSVFNS